MKREEYTKALISLGLTYLQATVYLNLAKLEKAEAKVIAEASNVARADVYRVMSTLERLGLVEKAIASPTVFKATPLKEGYRLLLERKKEEFFALQEQTADLISKVPVFGFEEKSFCEEEQFFLISSEKLSAKKRDLEDGNTQYSLDITGGFNLRTDELVQRPIHERALKRGVKIRIITEKYEGKPIDKYSPLFMNNPLFQVRYVKPPIPIRVAIYDQKKLNMSIRPPTDKLVTPTLWSSNPQFVNAIVAYYDELWKKADISPTPTREVGTNRLLLS